LIWMVCEASKAGLLINPERFKVVALGEGDKSKHNYCKPDMAAPIHSEMRHWYFKLLETLQGNLQWKGWKKGFQFGRARQITEAAYLHQSVIERKNKDELKYSPVNLPVKFEVIPYDAECIKLLSGGA